MIGYVSCYTQIQAVPIQNTIQEQVEVQLDLAAGNIVSLTWPVTSKARYIVEVLLVQQISG